MTDTIPKDKFTEAQEKAFLAYIRTLPSCLSGKTPCVPAHVRRVAYGSGIGRKPKLFAVPLTDEEHKYQHQHGELSAAKEYMLPSKYFSFSPPKSYVPNFDAGNIKIWFENQALDYRAKFLSDVWQK